MDIVSNVPVGGLPPNKDTQGTPLGAVGHATTFVTNAPSAACPPREDIQRKRPGEVRHVAKFNQYLVGSLLPSESGRGR